MKDKKEKKVKKKKERKAAKSTPLKTSINFIDANEKDSDLRLALPASILIIIAAVFFSKFAVVDRYQRLWEEQSKVSEKQAQIEANTNIIEESKALSDKYYHYTQSGMTEDELYSQSRVSVANLVKMIGENCKGVMSYSLTGNRLSVNITASSLESLSFLAQRIEGQDIVESATVTTAQSQITDYSKPKSDSVDAQLNIYISSKDAADGADTGSAADITEDVSEP